MNTVRSFCKIASIITLVAALILPAGCGSPKVTTSVPAISKTTMAVGEPVSIAVNVLSSEKQAVDFAVRLKVNGREAETKTVTIGPGETQTVTFEYTADAVGTHTVDVNGQTATFEAVAAAHITASGLAVEPENPSAGQDVQITAQLTNDGGANGAYSAVLIINGQDADTQEVEVAAGQTVTASVTYTPDTAGTYSVEFCGMTGQIKASKPPDFKGSGVSVSPALVYTGDSATVSATITNAGDVKGTQAVVLLVNGTEEGRQSVTLDPGATTTVSYTVTKSTAGSYTLTVLGSSATLSVKELSTYESRYYFWTISYPPDFTLNESRPTSITMEKAGTAAVQVATDRRPVGESPRQYFDALAAARKQLRPDWTSSGETEITKDGTIIGIKYDYSNTIDGTKWIGKGVTIKQGGLAFYVVFTAVQSAWEQNKALAARCLDTFVAPPIFTGAYSSATLGVALTAPAEWTLVETGDPTYLIWVYSPATNPALLGQVIVEPTPSGMNNQQYAQAIADQLTNSGYQASTPATFTFDNAAAGCEITATGTTGGSTLKVRVVSLLSGARAYSVMFNGLSSTVDALASQTTQLCKSMVLSTPGVAGVDKNSALFLLAGEIPTLDPALTEDAPGDIIGALFSGLVKTDVNLKIVPDLAESWTVSSDGKVYTFTLRRNAKFHSGKAVTAADVKYSWERACDPALKSPKASYFLADIVGAKDRLDGKATQISGVRVVDDYTLEVTIDAAKQYFLGELTQPVAFVVDKDNVAKGATWYEQPNGTGAFKLKSWEKDTLLVLERFDGFYLGAAKLKNLVFKLFAGVPMTLYESGEIDMTGVGIDDQDKVLDTTNPLNKQLVTGTSATVYYVGFNVTRAPFDDPKVRQAFAMALDVPKIIDVSLKGRADRAAGYVPQGIPAYNSALVPVSLDANQAKQLIAQSKYGGVDKLPAITLYTLYGATSVEEAAISMWQQNLGVQVKVEVISELATYMERLRRKEFQVFVSGWGADYIDPQNFLQVLFQTGSSENHFAYSNAAVDAALIAAAAEPDSTSRNQKYQDIEKAILADLPAVPLYRNLKTYQLLKPYVKGYVPAPISINQWLSIYVDPH